MCTVTIVRTGDLMRLAFNRDEQRQRAWAHPPFISSAGGLQALMPQDPQGRGTWVAANASGLVFAVLNVPDAPVPADASSRGVIIPDLVGARRISDVASAVDAIDPDRFAGFRLLVVGARIVIEFVRRGRRLEPIAHPLDRPLLFTSSSLGDALVDGPRRSLFEQMFGTPWDLAAQQDAYHAHRWRDQPAVSVHMSRPDACTVSTTVVEVTPRQVRMIYTPSRGLVGTPAGLQIARQGQVSSEEDVLTVAAYAS